MEPQAIIEILESKLAAIHNAAVLLTASVATNQSLLDEVDVSRLKFIVLESEPEEEPL